MLLLTRVFPTITFGATVGGASASIGWRLRDSGSGSSSPQRRYNSVPVGVRIVRERHLVLILEPTSRAIAYGLEQSMRILPS
jgi:hypothetical protein